MPKAAGTILQRLRHARWAAWLADAATGAAAALGQVPFSLWPVALAAFALVLWRLSSAPGAAAAFRRGLVIGAGHFAVALSWIVQPFLVDARAWGWAAPFALAGVALGFGLFWGLAGWIAGRTRTGAFGAALALSGMELVRGHLLGGFPWALPGQIWADTALAQVASLTGSHGMTALTLLALAGPLALGGRGLVLTLVVGVLAGGWSWHRLALPEPEARPGRVRIVQPDIAQSLKWDPDEARVNFSTLLALTGTAWRAGAESAEAAGIAGPGPELVIWPETAVPWLVEPGGRVAQAISEAAGGAPVATGIQREEGALAWNTLAVIGPGGTLGQWFDKIHLVPFGEYVPSGDFLYRNFGLRAFASQAGAGYSAGRARTLLDFGPLGRALPVICYEAIFPLELVTDERPDWIMQVTNDAWFGTRTGPYQHLALVRLTAIELGLPVLRAANTGISAAIDARGRIVEAGDGRLASLALGKRGVLDLSAIPGALPLTPHARTGDGLLALLLVAGLALFTVRVRRRLRRAARA